MDQKAATKVIAFAIPRKEETTFLPMLEEYASLKAWSNSTAVREIVKKYLPDELKEAKLISQVADEPKDDAAVQNVADEPRGETP